MTSTTRTAETSSASAAHSDGGDGLPRILQVLDLSTAHLPQELVEDLSSYDGVTAHRLPDGWLLYVPDESVMDGSADAPVEVLAIHRFARGLGCAYVLLDRDAETASGLPVWDW